MSRINRREFVEKAAAVTGALALGPAAIAAREDRKTARRVTDRRTLGKTGITASLLGIGTGSIGVNHASNQTRLGQEAFTRLIRHAFDSGITFFDVADQYGSHPFLREAIKGLPRDKFVIQTKSGSRTAEGMRVDLDRFRKELGVDTLDTVLMHCVTEPDWNTRFAGAKDVLSEAKQKGIIRAHGCSCHSLSALEAAAADPWVEVDLARFNPWGRHMDAGPEAVRPVLDRMKKAGKGVIGMKILAQGDMTRGEDRLARAQESLRFGLGSGLLDTLVIGFESTREVDEILGETRVALAELGRKNA